MGKEHLEVSHKVLVTGSEGFLGKRVVDFLEAAGHEVVRFDLALGQDISNRQHLNEAVSGCDVCIHLAAVSDLYVADSDPDACAKINVAGTANVALACRANDCRLLYASTCCVYGNNNCSISNESSPVVPTELYAKTKLTGEQRIAEIGGNYTIMRLATFYGPGMRSSLATYRFIEHMALGKEIQVHGDGEQTRCYTHVDDVARGIMLVLEAGADLSGKVINIADQTAYSVNELIAIIEEQFGDVAKKRFVTDRDGQIRSSVIDNSLLVSLGWKPSFSLVDGLASCMSSVIGEVEEAKLAGRK
jgi:nucleoside-diphosphate-sugar epimerase